MARHRAVRTRRRFLQGSLTLAGLGMLSGCGILPPQVQQAAKVPRIGYLTINSQANSPANLLDALREGLREAGHVEGRNITIDYRWADSRTERLPELAGELVQQNVDVIVTTGTGPLEAAHRATSTIPIVMTNAGDPVGLGIVAGLAHPGGNVTGLTSLSPELAPKRLQLLQESVPGVSRIGVLHNPDDPGRVRAFRETESAARTLGLQVRSLELRESDDLGTMLGGAIGERVDALVVLQGGAVNASSVVVDLVAQHRLPAMYDGGQFTDAGGLMFYGPNFVDLYRRAATYVDKILQGAKPGDLPIEQPTTFDFIINLNTARALGLAVPQSVLQQATEVIQ
jgi:putative tryptophan/tyrosine transport system substrate-binding protein